MIFFSHSVHGMTMSQPFCKAFSPPNGGEFRKRKSRIGSNTDKIVYDLKCLF